MERMTTRTTGEGAEFRFSEPTVARGTLPFMRDKAFDAALAQDTLDREASGMSRAEWAEYWRLKRSGDYKDDQVMRLRAMLNTGERSREDVTRMAWGLRRQRDMRLAQGLAGKYGGAASDYLVPTQLHQISVTKGDYLPAHLDRREEAARFFDSQLAFDRDSGDSARELVAKRRGRYLAARWGLRFDEDMEPVPGSAVRAPLVADSEGYVWTYGGNQRFRVGEDGVATGDVWAKLAEKGNELGSFSWAPDKHNYMPTRPNEPLRYKDGRPVTVPGRAWRPTGKWRLTAGRRPALRRALEERR